MNPGGIVTQWVPLYESDETAVKSEIATFFAVFPDGTIWSNDENGKGYDVVLLGQAGETKINLDEILARLGQSGIHQCRRSLKEVSFNNAFSLFATYAGRAEDLAPWLKGAPINHDQNLRLQYLAGLGLNLYLSETHLRRPAGLSQVPRIIICRHERYNLVAMKIALALAPPSKTGPATQR